MWDKAARQFRDADFSHRHEVEVQVSTDSETIELKRDIQINSLSWRLLFIGLMFVFCKIYCSILLSLVYVKRITLLLVLRVL